MFCQKCRTSLHLDSSLEDLSPAAIDLLSDTSTSVDQAKDHAEILSRPVFPGSRRRAYEEAVKHQRSPTNRQTHSTANDPFGPARADAGASFVLLSDSQITPPPNSGVAARLRGKHASKKTAGVQPDDAPPLDLVNRLFEVLSARSDIDHPICAECTSMLIDGMEKRLAGATRERDAYVDFLKDAYADAPTEEEQREAEDELKKIKAEEQQALLELEKLEMEKLALDEEAAALERETREVDEQESGFWRERNAFAQSLAAFQEERDSVNQRYDHDARLLERLQRTNVYNDTFNISHDGSFGTINGLRLGRLSSATVEWAEINAAWGQACLLLATIADKLNFQFQGYKLKPMGSTSSIEKFDLPVRGSASKSASVSSLPLYHSSELPINLGFLHRNFDNAMVAILECVRQLGKHVEKITQGTDTGGEKGLVLPYTIKKDRIEDCSIKLGSGFGGDESWSKACKLTLTCCKYLLAATSK